MATKRKTRIKPREFAADFRSETTLADRITCFQRILISLTHLIEWDANGRRGDLALQHQVWLGLLDRGAAFETTADLPRLLDLAQAVTELAGNLSDPTGVAEDFSAAGYETAVRSLKARIQAKDVCGAGEGKLRTALEYVGLSAEVGYFRAMKVLLEDLNQFRSIFFDVCLLGRQLPSSSKQKVFDLVKGSLWPVAEAVLRWPGPFGRRRRSKRLAQNLVANGELADFARELNDQVGRKPAPTRP